MFSTYEGELNLVKADLDQKLDQIPEMTGEARKSAIRSAEGAVDEAKELLGNMNLEKSNIPSSVRARVNTRFRNHQSNIDNLGRKLKTLSSDRKALFGDRYTDDPDDPTADVQLEQRQQLLSGTERLGRSGERLRESQRIALETEQIGAGTLADLHQQRNVIENTHRNLQQSEGYVDRSVKTLRGMSRR